MCSFMKTCKRRCRSFTLLLNEKSMSAACLLFTRESSGALLHKVRDTLFKILCAETRHHLAHGNVESFRERLRHCLVYLALDYAHERGLTVEASSWADSWAFSRKVSWGKTRFTNPMRSASAASMVRAENSRSSAFAIPMIRGNIQAIPYSAISPRRANVVLKRLASEASRRSQ